MQITNYPQIFTLGHKAIIDIFKTPVVVEEKIDGSQFSFRLNLDGSCEAKSKSCSIVLESKENIPKIFLPAVQTMMGLAHKLKPGWTYRGEALYRPKHNTLAYSRIPTGGFILFDIDDGNQNFLSRSEKEAEAERLGLEIVPAMFQGQVLSFDSLVNFLQEESCLGGVKIEGFVVKNYEMFVEQFKTVMIGKYVSESFKEKHNKEWKVGTDFIQSIIINHRTEARWDKAVQHLRDEGVLQDAPEDIGPLLKELQADVLKEEGEEIKEKLFKKYWKEIIGGVCKGFPEWYKEKIAKQSFVEEEEICTVS